MSQRLWIAAILLTACTAGPAPFDTDTLSSDDNDDTDIPDIVYPDRDKDGSTSDVDCDD